jgi:hypothetical protein
VAPGAKPARVSIRRRSTIVLLVDVLAARGLQDLDLGTQRDLDLAVALLGRHPDGFQERQHLPPLDVPARGMAKILSSVSRCRLLRSAAMRRPPSV